MGKSPEAAIFLLKAPVLPAASRAYTLDGGESYEKQQHRKPLLHESGGVRRDRPAAAGDRRGGRRRRGLRPRAAGAGTRAGHPDARDPRRAGTDRPAGAGAAAGSRAGTRVGTGTRTHLHPAGLLRRGGGRDPDCRSLQLHAGQADAAPAAEQPRFSAGRADRPDRPYAFERGLYHGGRI